MVVAPMKNGRMMLATHTTALFSAVLMFSLGLIGPQLRLGAKARAFLIWALIISQYFFLVTGAYSAFAGTSSMFAGPPGMKGTASQETIAFIGNTVGVFGATIAAIMAVWGLRGSPEAAEQARA
jgi:hypothetical protein